MPSRAFAPAESSRPPMTNVGSRPPSASTVAMRLVVVVLPCVPATAMPCFRRMSSASISARGTTGMPRSRAASDLRIVGRAPPSTRRRRRRRRRCRARGRSRSSRRASRGARVAALSARSEPRHLVALRHEHLGDAAHPGAADADEVDALDLVLHRGVPSATQASATRSAASGRASLRARDGHREQRRAHAADARGERLAASAPAAGSCTAAPASTRNCAFALCSSAIAPGSGTMMRATPTAASSATVSRAAAADHEVRLARSAPPCRR